MTGRVRQILEYLQAGGHHALRRDVKWKLAEEFAKAGESPLGRVTKALIAMLAAEKPVLIPGERIVYTRTVKQLPELYTPEEWTNLHKEHALAEKGVIFNLCCDFASTMALGLDARRQEAVERMKYADEKGRGFLKCVVSEIDAVLELAERYRAAAEAACMSDVAAVLAKVPHKGATTFREALQFFRILHFTLWCEGEYHNGTGRFDQYMMPYLKHDLESGIETEESAFDLLEEFFLTFHRDSDLYIGVQQGDNGQSMVLGGCDAAGKDAGNLLTMMCLRASCELGVIEPKINLRVNRNTPFEMLRLGTELTAKGLGFPQYSNDDVVIPALVKWGYSLEDARNYVVAACWEFTIPGCGMDVPNLGAISLPEAVLECMKTSRAASFDAFLDELGEVLRSKALSLNARYDSFIILPGPFASLLCDGFVQNARDMSEGGRYNNFGVHGTGLATAVDSLCAINMLVFEEKKLTMADFCKILSENFAGNPEILAEVRNKAPKMGGADARADSVAQGLLRIWPAAWDGIRTVRGGIWRPGTGSAMYYVSHSQNLGATPDGRLAGEPFPANYSPGLTLCSPGPVSVVRSFTGPDLKPVCNGGPLTLELHDSVFSMPDGVEKAAHLVELFIARGGHQLQLNSINRDRLLEAQKNPDKYKNLIVRVWGWSGYFVELDKVYQDHIIKRAEMVF